MSDKFLSESAVRAELDEEDYVLRHGHKRRNPAAIRASHAAALQETVTEIGNLLGLVRAGSVKPEDPQARVLLHSLVKRLRSATADAESDLLHLARDGRWRASLETEGELP